MNLGCLYCPLVGSLNHAHELADYLVIRLIEFFVVGLADVATPECQVQPNSGFLCFAF